MTEPKLITEGPRKGGYRTICVKCGHIEFHAGSAEPAPATRPPAAAQPQAMPPRPMPAASPPGQPRKPVIFTG